MIELELTKRQWAMLLYLLLPVNFSGETQEEGRDLKRKVLSLFTEEEKDRVVSGEGMEEIFPR